VAKHWREVKNEIEEEIDRIWWDEPEEVTMSRLGIFPSGAGTDGQVLGNLLFLVADTQAHPTIFGLFPPRFRFSLLASA
jgi:hypothetical protein